MFFFLIIFADGTGARAGAPVVDQNHLAESGGRQSQSEDGRAGNPGRRVPRPWRPSQGNSYSFSICLMNIFP